MDALAALELQLEWGADEALTEEPVDRTAAPMRTRAVAAPPDQPQPEPPHPDQPHRNAPRPVAPRSPAELPLAPPGAHAQHARALAEACHTREELHEALAHFDGCALALTATHLVFADGNPDSGLMLVGEGPGAEEDRAGVPFVGASGQLLSRMLASIGLDRTRYLITNLIPWRPPGNRNPTDTEVQVCLPFLQRHIALVRPRRLVLLGKLSTGALLGTAVRIQQARGKWVEVTVPGLETPVPALPMLHPAFLLRNAGAKRAAWADMVELRRSLDADADADAGASPENPAQG